MHKLTIIKLTAVFAMLTGVVSQAQAQDEEPVPELEPVDWVQAAVEHGFDSWAYAASCRSVGSDGSVIEGDPLPVSADRWLECQTGSNPLRKTEINFDAHNELFCMLAEASASSFVAEGDERLAIEITDRTSVGPWSLRATSRAGDAFTIGTVEGPGGGRMWPLWTLGHLDVTRVEHSMADLSCDAQFGL